MKKFIIKNIIPDSIAEEAGIVPGDVLLSVNSQAIDDVFDYRFAITEEQLAIELEKPDGEIWEIEIEKDEYEDLGIEFEDSMMDDAKSCTNKCIFCFIDQLPKGMRDTLYFKDDDSRLSFLMGNYITLTNMKKEDIDRIIRYKMSPINVSVHTTNSDLRVFMLKNRFAGDILPKIKKLVDGGITINCQIVLCRDINDRNELDRSISELSAMYPGIASISIVPVGITRHRHGLAELKPYDAASSLKVIEQVEKWQEKLIEQYGSRIVYLADEFYIMADRQIPDYESYEDFPQLENGVGMIALFRHEFDRHLSQAPVSLQADRLVSIATGVSSYKYIKEMAEILGKRYNNLKVNVYAIKNNFFGKNVTVTGLITGSDIIDQLTGKHLGDELLISKSMLRAGEDVLLDDYTVGMLEDKLNVHITAVNNDGADFINKLTGRSGGV